MQRAHTIGTAIVLAGAALLACQAETGAPASDTGQPAATAAEYDAGRAIRAPDAAADATAGVAADCPGGDEGAAPETSPVALQAWLRTRAYTCWARESHVHRSGGPHGGNVRVYLNASLARSLGGAGEHPAGGVAVKELYGAGTDDVTGWAVGVKTAAASAGGQGWYWYEAFSTGENPSVIEGQGKELCASCHAGGDDFVLIPFPLR